MLLSLVVDLGRFLVVVLAVILQRLPILPEDHGQHRKRSEGIASPNFGE
jgi:hypothetical protein